VRTPVSLWTELLVREDLMQLFGFLTVQEREWHRLLTSVQGIGAKGSLAILGTLGADGVARAIALGDANAVRAAPGVGPKIAQRVVLELKGKAPAMMLMEGGSAPDLEGVADGPLVDSIAVAPKVDASAQSEALSALSNLGYAPVDAARAVAEAASAGGDTPDLIRAALKLLAPRD
jgi:Holliday junction DNA helicase RuvA